MNRNKIHKAHFHSKAPYLDPFPRFLLFCIGAYFVVSTATQVFSQAPLVVFLVGCVFAFAGLNGLRLATFSFSKEGFKFESYQVPFQTPVTHRMLKRYQSDATEDLDDRGWTPVEINGITKQSIAGIATTASGETTHPDQINRVYAIKDDINHLVVFTSDGRTLNLDFAQASESDSRVGIQ
jgi:hypothetical protein